LNEGLYISGAETNLACGITGTQGHVAAQALLNDQGRQQEQPVAVMPLMGKGGTV